MALKFLPLTLRFDYFGTPGTGGTSLLNLRATEDGIKISNGVPAEGLVSEGLVSSEAGWRGVVTFLAQNEECAFYTDGNIDGEFPWPERMESKGKENAAKDIIAMAWAGEPLVTIATALCNHTDEVLTDIREKYGSLRDDDFIEGMLRIKRWADEFSVDLDAIIARGPRFGFDFRAMRRDVGVLARVVKADDEAARLRREWCLSPFQSKIDHLVAAWHKANPATSTNTQMGKGMQAGALKAFLESYVLENGCMPEGRVRVPESRQLQAFEVDLAR